MLPTASTSSSGSPDVPLRASDRNILRSGLSWSVLRATQKAERLRGAHRGAAPIASIDLVVTGSFAMACWAPEFHLSAHSNRDIC